MMSAMICPELPEVQRTAMRMNVKLPLVYNKVLISDWRAFANAGVYEIGAPMAYHSRVMLDYPTSIGSYRAPSDPSEPMVVHMGHDTAYRGSAYQHPRSISRRPCAGLGHDFRSV
jgi:spermidine dehydrogenase